MSTSAFLYVLPHHIAFLFFFFNDTATTEIYTLSLHDALPIYPGPTGNIAFTPTSVPAAVRNVDGLPAGLVLDQIDRKSNTSELQSLAYLVCRLLLEKKKKKYKSYNRCMHS